MSAAPGTRRATLLAGVVAAFAPPPPAAFAAANDAPDPHPAWLAERARLKDWFNGEASAHLDDAGKEPGGLIPAAGALSRW